MAKFFPSTVGRSLEFMVVKTLVKNLEMKTTAINGPGGKFNFFFFFIQQNHKVGISLFV